MAKTDLLHDIVWQRWTSVQYRMTVPINSTFMNGNTKLLFCNGVYAYAILPPNRIVVWQNETTAEQRKYDKTNLY